MVACCSVSKEIAFKLPTSSQLHAVSALSLALYPACPRYGCLRKLEELIPPVLTCLYSVLCCSNTLHRLRSVLRSQDVINQHALLRGNKMPTRCNRGFYYRSYCLLNMFRAPLCPSSGAQEYYTVVAACGIS